MARIAIKRSGPGRPRTRPDRVAGDKGYSSRKIRAYLRKRGIACTIPERTDQIKGRRRRGETLCPLDRTAYPSACSTDVPVVGLGRLRIL